ncbi:MAG: hypothetical protein AAF573_12195 [Bacteroidota bacterium]
MWDLAIIEALAHPDFATKKIFSTPPENISREIEIYTHIEVDSMKMRFWEKLDQFYQ